MERIKAIVKKIGVTKAQAIILAICLAFTVLFHLTKTQQAFMDFVTNWLILPLQTVLRTVCSVVPFSVSELTIAAGVAAIFVWLITGIRAVIKRKGLRLKTVVTRLTALLCAVLIGTTAFDWMWGAFYYRSSMQKQTGFYAEPITAKDLLAVTQYFAEKAGETADKPKRSENGDLKMSPYEIAMLSPGVYDGIEEEFPLFQKPRTTPKVLVLSEGLSYLDTTGFFFPYLGESNINGHSPRTSMPATAVHELAHQMGIASEQEANFAAVLACTSSDIPEFAYSGWQMGLVYLLNASYRADREGWREIAASLSDTVRADLTRINEYWAKYETPVSEVANNLNSGRQENYGQNLETQSYGAVVDLLVKYYIGECE